MRIERILAACALLLLALSPGVSANEIVGEVEWPEECVVFAQFERDDPMPGAGALASVPESMARPDGTVVEGRRAAVPRGERLDLNDFFDEPKVGATAWIFYEVPSRRAQRATIGMGADWWFTAWVNGEEAMATPDSGNSAWPPSPADFTATVELREGTNVVAVRFVSGAASALFAAGGPEEIRAVTEQIGGDDDPMRFNRPVPFTERMPFDLDRQAFASAEMPFELPEADADLSAGALVGLREMPKRQLEMVDIHAGRFEVLDREYRRFPLEPVKILLSKSKYPAEDRHIDAVVWTTPPEGEELAGSLEVAMRDAAGAEVARHAIEEASPKGWFFSMGFPGDLVGGAASLEVSWLRNGEQVARAEEAFEVLPPEDVERAGRVAIRLVNEPGATARGVPMTVGVPFPRGALAHESHARLVDEGGEEIPLQTKVTARWSRFGDVKWLLCDFVADMDGGAREVFLEYGPGARRSERPALSGAEGGAGLPALDAGRLRITEAGLEFDPLGDGSHRPVLSRDALQGAFVRREDGRAYGVPADTPWAWEEVGGEKAALRRVGWYEHAESGERFCNFVTRVVFHRGSPFARVFHTWIFTGDGNRDRVRDMGWRFEGAEGVEPGGILTGFHGEWAGAARLAQHGFDRFLLEGGEETEGRAPGVLAADIGESRVFFGAKDFWQNFPSELAFSDGAFTFYNWPRNNPPAYHETPIPPSRAYLIPFAHQGELLDFRLPDEYAEDPIWGPASGNGAETYWEKGEPESANAQGIARTEEMILYFADRNTSREDAARVMQGLNDETLRAVVDPKWVVATGVFGPIHYRDTENYALDEAVYEEVCHAPARWNERLDFYGMWLHGESPAWSINPATRGVSLYRTLRMNHHGWPIKWGPYARSGDPRLLKYADAAVRQLTDVNFCHFASEDVDRRMGENRSRRQGRWSTTPVPWTSHSPNGPGTRGISQDCDYLWHSYYMTGYHRAVDVLQLWAELVKIDTTRISPGRGSVSNMHVALDMYKATFDPWFLVTVHEFAKMHRAVWAPEEPVERMPAATVGHFWKPADRDFYWFTNDEAHRDVALNVSASWSSPWTYTGSWNILDVPYIEESATAYHLTGDDYFLARAAGYVDWANMAVYDAEEPEWFRGTNTRYGQGVALGIFTGWYIQQMPLALGAFERAGFRPDPVPNPFMQFQRQFERIEVDGETYDKIESPTVVVRKETEDAMPFLLDTWRPYDLEYTWTATGPDGETAAEGTWDLTRTVAEIPSGTPPGLYRLRVEGLHPNRWEWPGTHGAPFMPLAKPDVPEVMAFERGEDGTSVGGARLESQYWFMVPEGTEEFWLDLRHPDGLARATVWDPDGGRAWDYEPDLDAEDGPRRLRVTLDVPAGQGGRLWRVSVPGSAGGHVTFDPRIPPYFSVSRPKWFDPEEE